MNLLKLAMTFLCASILAAALGLFSSWGGVVDDLATFFFFLCTALFVVFGLTHLFWGDPEKRRLDTRRSSGTRHAG